MLLFRSEEHVEKWLRDWNMPRGAVFSLDTCNSLARAWYGPDRREPEWKRRTVDETQALLSELGLTSDFWRLKP